MTDAIFSWQMAVLVACLALCAVYFRERPSRHALLALLCYTGSVVFFNLWIFTEDLDYAFKLFNAGINLALVMYLGALFYFLFHPLNPNDLAAKLLWMIVLIAEAWSVVFNNIGCNLVLETATREELRATWGISASRYVCGREIGEWFEFMPLVLEIGLMAWIIHRYVQVNGKARNKTIG